MNIIAAHQQGLIEQLEDEVAALAGRPGDYGQRAVVLHHLFDHSGGWHVWALAEARQQLRIGSGIAALRQKLDRWGWTIARRGHAREALELLAEALGVASTARMAAAHRAYRLSATPALSVAAEERLPAGLLEALRECHCVRRLGELASAETRQSLNEESERLSATAVDLQQLDAAWDAINSTGLKRSTRRLIGDRALARSRARDERRDPFKVERELRFDHALPASFRSNPAQHFYALQRMLRNRRTQLLREACDREAGAFELAA